MVLMSPVRSGVDQLVGHKLEYVRLGHAIALNFSGGHQVLIETVARLNGRVDVVPGEVSAEAVAVLLGDVVRDARTCDTGELQISFAGGATLLVGADDDFESWAVAAPDGSLTICLAHGELAVWGGRS